MPTVSIILPCYNVELYLEKSIKSIINQTYQDFELLVIIDGSPDNSQLIAEQFAEQDDRIKVFIKENGGLSDARNYGLERASGEFIYFIDSDDWIESNLLEDNLNLLESQSLDFIIFGYTQDNEDLKGEILSSKSVIPIYESINKNYPSLTLDSHHLGLLGYAWNKIYRKSFLDQHQFKFQKGVSLVEDILFNAPIYSISNNIVFNNKSYYHYINRQVPTLMKQFHINSYDLKKIKNRVLNDFLTKWNILNKNEILAFSHIQGIRYCIHNLFSFKNQLNIYQKYNFIKMMFSDKETKSLINFYKVNSITDSLYKFFIKKKLIIPIFIIALTK